MLLSCKKQKTQQPTTQVVPAINIDTSIKKIEPKQDSFSNWKELTVEQGFDIDLKYASTENFTGQIIYSCPRCFVRPQLAEKLLKINDEIKQEKNYRLKLFDCYRPKSSQQKLWDIFPNRIYVADPKKGSMHNRGVAVDITFVDNKGIEIDMGTVFDHFGKEAHHSYKSLENSIYANRLYLKTKMEAHGFNSITSEWWHYSLNGTGFGASDWLWPCK